MVENSDVVIAIGGGEVARDELTAAKRSGKRVQFIPADMNHRIALEKALKKGQPAPTDFRGAAATAALAAQPGFDCAKTDGAVEALICRDAELAALDRKLAEVYEAAMKRVTQERYEDPSPLQRAWVKRRNDCGKADDVRGCVSTEYRRRIAELQIQYGHLMAPSPVSYHCGDMTLTAVFYRETNPPAVVLTPMGRHEGADQAIAFLEPLRQRSQIRGRQRHVLGAPWRGAADLVRPGSCLPSPLKCHFFPGLFEALDILGDHFGFAILSLGSTAPRCLYRALTISAAWAFNQLEKIQKLQFHAETQRGVAATKIGSGY